MNFENLITKIKQTHTKLNSKAISQVNYYNTLRNWLIGYFIVEFEQHGEDRATYGNAVLKNLAGKLLHIKGMSMTNLKLFRQFYQVYPEIGQTLSDQLIRKEDSKSALNPQELLTQLNFSHFIELIRVQDALKRNFYEVEAIKNAWKVRDLARAIDTLLFERTGLSVNKDVVIAKVKNNQKIEMADMIKNPYLLEFLGLEEKPEYTEHDLESAIIGHLQNFLTEMGRGFCFEARQKRITFDNVHYRIDLVFYHRILKSHILLDLKLGPYDHADAGQMNLYLNYYRKHEMSAGDNPPVGIILCADKNDALVEYTTTGLPNEVFVSKYLVQLPSKETLESFIRNEMNH
ncbi:PDDEXK nuclease domain-containing protein [Pedobacter gandavensis]|uniref:DUF1016 family protein n=1 Tax=Pedobacter gandavensis TaxID=2679963 RepID=A0ABR6F1K9_9SPHI|nr:PDDEXK nuclease domain-containing protein [Pedobacter gandavensis]MBB2151413.1 DUF1016 family protein [Pedobacter gandavensis]